MGLDFKPVFLFYICIAENMIKMRMRVDELCGFKPSAFDESVECIALSFINHSRINDGGL